MACWTIIIYSRLCSNSRKQNDATYVLITSIKPKLHASYSVCYICVWRNCFEIYFSYMDKVLSSRFIDVIYFVYYSQHVPYDQIFRRVYKGEGEIRYHWRWSRYCVCWSEHEKCCSIWAMRILLNTRFSISASFKM